MTRGLGLAFVAALLVAGCGGSSSPTGAPIPSATPSPTPSPRAGPLVLESGNFATLVLASERPCLVEFHRPT